MSMAEKSQVVLDIEIQDGRVRFLDKLYDEDGRGDKSHPYHSRYTGLYQQYLEKLEQG